MVVLESLPTKEKNSKTMKQEDLKLIVEALAKGGIKGDFVMEKHVEYEVNNVERGGIGIQINGVNRRASNAPVLELLDELVKSAIQQHPKSPKHILLPVRAAKEAEALPMVDLKWVNDRYELQLNPTNWSDWVTKADTNYDNKELSPLIEDFQKLKNSET